MWLRGPADAGATTLAHRVAVAAVFLHGRACDFATGERLPLIAGELARAISRTTEALID
jgi:NAD(P)H-hydrate repair Nnr-like enzyme with NAD(P)H-hydrate dehydratase domain